MPSICLANVFCGAMLEGAIFHDALAGGGPHVAHVQIRPSITVIVKPGGAHPRSGIANARFFGDVPKAPALIQIKIAAPKIIGDVEIGPAVAIEIAPGRSKAVAVAVLTDARSLGDVLHPSAAVCGEFVVKEEIRWAVARVVVRRRISILIFALEIDVSAEIEIDA